MDRFRDYGQRGLRGGLTQLGDFRKFILRGNVVDLAVGIVIGAAFTAVVTAIVSGVITPLIGLFGVPNFSNLTTPFHGQDFKWGAVINAVLSFLIVAAVVYFLVVKPVTALQDRFTPHHDEAPTTRECPFCLSTVPLRATRCAYCTAQLPPADTNTPATGPGGGSIA
ncbi:MAG TPA: large conductance mechanosensitive channel protein MscL [Ktedonobacter sp.]|nr:large conductance mechanosensitive channel protein MscL [Ktedonobacter sp.]